MPAGVLLDPLPGHSQLVSGQMHHMERIHHLPRLRQLLGGGGVVAGESVHRHDFHPVAEGLLPGGEPAAQHLSGSARHHVQQPGGPGAVHVRRQVDDDGDETGGTVATAVFPFVLIDPQHADSGQVGGISVDQLPGLFEGYLVNQVPADVQGL